jgi:hypothetical protein
MENEQADAPRRMVQQPSPPARILVFMFTLMWWYTLQGPPQTGAAPRDLFQAKMARDWHSLDVLNLTKWGDFAPGVPGSSGGRYLNLAGFRQRDNYAWDMLGLVQNRFAKVQLYAGLGAEESGADWAVYQNATGVVKGKWTRTVGLDIGDHVKGPPALNLSEIAPDTYWWVNDWTRNITGKEGVAMLEIREKGAKEDTRRLQNIRSARAVSATLTLQDDTSTGDGWVTRLHGFHWPKNGTLVMTTTSDKYAGTYGLPHLTSSEEAFEDSKMMLNQTLGRILRNKEKAMWDDMSHPGSENAGSGLPHCEYLVYAQLHPISRTPTMKYADGNIQSVLEEIERELRHPQGLSMSKVPSLDLSFVVFSPDCGFVLESKGPPVFTKADGQHLKGYKQEVQVKRTQRWILIFGAVLFAQVYLLLGQMKDASTPSTASRISVHTLAMIFLSDLIFFMGLMILAGSAPSYVAVMSVTGFTAALGVGLGARFTVTVYSSQEPERIESQRRRDRETAERAAQNAAEPSAPATSAPDNSRNPELESDEESEDDQEDRLPRPATAQGRGDNNPIIIPSDQDIDAEIFENTTNGAAAVPTTAAANRGPSSARDVAANIAPVIIGAMLFFLLSIAATQWPTWARSFYCNLLATMYLSVWIPQIYRNVIRNCRRPLQRRFVIGQSMLRTAPIAYFYIKEDNFLFTENDWVMMGLLAAWLWIQIWVLLGQEVLGPRYGIPKGWLPEAWDYHPILREDDVEGGGLPIGLVQAPASARNDGDDKDRKKADDHTRSVDCAICMNTLEIPVVPRSADESASGVGGVQDMLSRRAYMITPCRHAFHSECLEGWMRFRLQCPICREQLPPL